MKSHTIPNCAAASITQEKSTFCVDFVLFLPNFQDFQICEHVSVCNLIMAIQLVRGKVVFWWFHVAKIEGDV